MSDTTTTIKCRKCGNPFQPDMKTRKLWFCPNCQEKHPNLKRHYRSVADLCLLGFLITIIYIVLYYNQYGLNLGVLLSAGHALLLLVMIVFVYKSREPWADGVAKALIWTVFGLAFVLKALLPLVLFGALNVPVIVVFSIMFPYLFWLNAQANKCILLAVSENSDR